MRKYKEVLNSLPISEDKFSDKLEYNPFEWDSIGHDFNVGIRRGIQYID